jgi:branched-chain amino acid transport system ATP-binding protein
MPADPSQDAPVTSVRALDPTDAAERRAGSAAAARAAAAALEGVEPRPGVPKPDPILVADGVARRFGGLTAVEVDHLEVQRGVITALIGPNGAGKTTFFNLLTGFDNPNEGSWSFEGKDLGGVPAHKVARRGMVRTFQLTKALSKLSVLDNMRLGATGQKGENFFRALIPGSGPASSARSTPGRDLLVRFKLDAKETTSPAACPADSASCSRWRVR